MRSPLSSADRYAPILLFLFLEIICFILIVTFNHKQNEIFLHSSTQLSGSLLNKSRQIKDFTSLQVSNQELLAENARLLKEVLGSSSSSVIPEPSSSTDYTIETASVITNSISSSRNMITIDIGQKKGLSGNYGVINNQGVVGILTRSTNRFSSVMPLLNVDSRISGSIEGLNFFGSVTWSGYRYDQLVLQGIPTHANVNVGDAVVTTGYSLLFPPGIKIGSVHSIKKGKDGAFYDIEISPAVDFADLSYVYVIRSVFFEEIDSLSYEHN